MNFKLKKIHLFVILLIALIGCCIQMPHFNLGFNLGFNEGFKDGVVDQTQDAYLPNIEYHEDTRITNGEGDYSAISVTGGAGIDDMEVDITINNDNKVTSLRVTNPGTGYEKGDEITVDLAVANPDANPSAEGKFTFTLYDTTAAAGTTADTEEGKSSFQEEGRMNPLVLFNTMVNGESNSSITEIKDSAEIEGSDQFTMQNRDLMGSPINLSESSPSRSVSVKNQNQKKNQNPLSSFLANIFGGKKEGMENEGNPAYPGKEGEEDQWILKSKIVPPVCPKCPEPTCDTKKCPPCPSCERCPEPAFECKKVPNYRSTNDNYLPRPVLADFSQFGM